MIVGWNGSLKQAEEAVISVYDHGFLYGMGLFETFRTYGGQPYLLDRHLERLADGCRELGISYKEDVDRLRDWLAELMRVNGLKDAYVRLTVTAGEAELGLPQADYESPNVLLLVKPLPAVNERLYHEGRQLALLKSVRNTPEGDVRLKSLHYMNNIIAKRELRTSGAAQGAEGLMMTREGSLAEGIVSNLFFVRDGVIHTPSIGTGILPGITRARVIELAQAKRLAVKEGFYDWGDLLQAEEVWVTNSIQELVPVTSLRDREGSVSTVGSGSIGRMTERLLSDYRYDASQLTSA